MSSTYTPGPWVAASSSSANSASVWTGNGDIQIARCHSGALSVGGNRANARLIAAAPELLQALRDATEALRHLQDSLAVKVNPPTLEKCVAAIARATGA